MDKNTSIPGRVWFLQQVFRHLPLSGRYLSDALRISGIDLSTLSSPLICRDRWDNFDVEISTASDIIERHILFQGYFEYWESRFIRRLLKPGQVFVDIGANIGWHSLLAAACVGQQGRVLSFEPATAAFNHLVRNIRLNGFTQAEAFHYGLSTRKATFEIYPCEAGNSGANSLYASSVGPPIECVEVMPGDEILDDLRVSEVDLVKIDVEGAELDVLDGLENTLKARRIHVILIEINPESLRRAHRTPDELISRLLAYGYRLAGVRSGARVERASDMGGELNFVCRLA